MARCSVVKGHLGGGRWGKQPKGSEFVFRTHSPPWDKMTQGPSSGSFSEEEESHGGGQG